MNFQATGEYLILEAIDTQRASGLIVADDKGDPLQKGKIISVGSSVTEPLLKENVVLWFKRPNGFDIQINGEKYIYINQDACIAVVI